MTISQDKEKPRTFYFQSGSFYKTKQNMNNFSGFSTQVCKGQCICVVCIGLCQEWT